MHTLWCLTSFAQQNIFKSLHVAACSSVFFFAAEKYLTVRINHMFNHLPADGYLVVFSLAYDK